MSGVWKSDVDRNHLDEKRSPSRFEPSGRPARPSYDEHDGSSEERSSKDNSRERPSLSRPFSFRDFDSTPPPVMSMKDILGDIPGLRVEIYKQSNGGLEGVPPWSQGSTVSGHMILHRWILANVLFSAILVCGLAYGHASMKVKMVVSCSIRSKLLTKSKLARRVRKSKSAPKAVIESLVFVWMKAI